jgi:hypothetical protein
MRSLELGLRVAAALEELVVAMIAKGKKEHDEDRITKGITNAHTDRATTSNVGAIIITQRPQHRSSCGTTR